MISRILLTSATLLASTVLAALTSASAADLSSSPPSDTPKIFDELRFGVSGSVQSGHDHEAGAMADVQVLFNPFGYNPTGDWQDQLVHPRIHWGTSVGTTLWQRSALRWPDLDADIIKRFLHGSRFGGVVHDGNLTDENDGPKLG